MRLVIGAAVGLALLMPDPTGAADLNAPAEKRPTIASELMRGYNCINIVLGAENRKNTDTDAFLLGIYSSALVRLTRYEDQYGRFTWNNGRLGLTVGKEWYLRTMSLQRKLDILDQQLSAVMPIPAPYFDKVKARWESQKLIP
jgi:hypothetical protein